MSGWLKIGLWTGKIRHEMEGQEHLSLECAQEEVVFAGRRRQPLACSTGGTPMNTYRRLFSIHTGYTVDGVIPSHWTVSS